MFRKYRQGVLHHVIFCVGLCPCGRTFFLIKLAQTSGFRHSVVENPKSLRCTTGTLFFPASELLPPDGFSFSSLSRQTVPRVRLEHKHRWDARSWQVDSQTAGHRGNTCTSAWEGFGAETEAVVATREKRAMETQTQTKTLARTSMIPLSGFQPSAEPAIHKQM